MPLGPFLCAQSSIFDPSKRLTIHLTGKQVKQTGQLEVWRRCDNVFCRIFVQCVGLNVWFLVACEALRRMTFITPWRWNGYGGWMCRRFASGSKPWQLGQDTTGSVHTRIWKKGQKNTNFVHSMWSWPCSHAGLAPWSKLRYKRKPPLLGRALRGSGGDSDMHS